MGKKGRKAKDCDWEDDVANEINAMAAEHGFVNDNDVKDEPKRAVNAFAMLNADDDVDEDSSNNDDGVNVKSDVNDDDPLGSSCVSPPVDKGNDDEGPRVKTAAQKKAEKKEKEKKKKEAEKNKKREAELKTAAMADTMCDEVDVAPTVTDIHAEECVIADDANLSANEAVEESASDAKKKKKKKKKAAAAAAPVEEPKKKKQSAAIRAMQEALKMKKELEDRQAAEQAEAERVAAEEEARRLEIERLAEEKRQLKKQKEKEKKERLRKEGKLLSKTEKARLAKQQAQREALKAAGFVVDGPKDDGEPRKKVVYGKKKKSTPKMEDVKSEECEDVAEDIPVEESLSNLTIDDDEPIIDDWETADIDELVPVKSKWDDEEIEDENAKEKITPVAVKKESIAEKCNDDNDDGDDDDESGSDTDSDDDAVKRPKDMKLEAQKNDAAKRIAARKAEAESKKSKENLRSPICCVLGHVDTGKTKILDNIRRTNVQDGEAGGITQQIGATYFPASSLLTKTEAVRQLQHHVVQSKFWKNVDIIKANMDINVPGLLVIDTPGHESFTNLRSRGSSLCDIAILVVDMVHGLEPQTLESIQLLRMRKTPFVVALNKVDRLFDWSPTKDAPLAATLRKQKKATLSEYNDRVQATILAFAAEGLNAKLYYENQDLRNFISLVPTSAHTGEGIQDLLLLLCQLSQSFMGNRLAYVDNVECTVLEVKVLEGLGTTVDVILSNGVLREGDTIVVCGKNGPIVTDIRALLMPEPLKELRVKNQYRKHKEVYAAQGIKVSAQHLADTIAGTQLYVAHCEDDIEYLKGEVMRDLDKALNSFSTQDRGVSVQASTLGSLEALLSFLESSKIPVSAVNIGPVHKKDIIRTSVMLNKEENKPFAMLLAFDVKVDKDAQDLADEMGVKVFTADIIYHLFDAFTNHMEQVKMEKKERFSKIAVFPCRLRILPECIFNTRAPIVIGVDVVEGILRSGTPICVPSQGRLEIGFIASIEKDNKVVKEARQGSSVCIKIESSDTPKLYGRHFTDKDELVSKLTRESINALKEVFRDEMKKTDWVLVVKLKKIFDII